ncbi:MAG: GPW/gp25 family protein [Bryobacteraceae bacterium]
MAKEFLGNGWRFPILPDESGGLGYVAGDPNVEQSLRILLLTELGQRVMRPGFGSRAPRMVFVPGSVANLRLLETTVREAVRDFEPRVELEQVAAEADAEDATRITVSIGYRVRSTNTRQNLVFPYYLGTTGRP